MESAAEPSHHLLLKILMQIFADVDLHTLVFSCRHVCRFWKDAVESPDLWKIKIFRKHGHKYETDRALITAHLDYPWYICYAICGNVFDRNIFSDSEETPRVLRDLETVGDIRPVPFNSCTEGFGEIPQELTNKKENECSLCNSGVNSKNHIIDLYTHGLTRKIMQFQPPIHISEWFTGRLEFIVFCHTEVKLCNSEGRYDTQHGYFRSQRIDLRKCHNVSRTFSNYGPDVRYVMLAHRIDTGLPPIHATLSHGFLLNLASNVPRTRLIVSRPDPSRPSDSMSSSSSSSSSSTDSRPQFSITKLQ